MQKFKEDFERNYRFISNNEGLPFPFWSESFSKLCLTSMRTKKPMLVLVLKDGTPENYKAGLTTFTRTASVNEMVNNNFMFTGFVMTELPLPAFETLLNLGDDVRAVLYFAVVTHEMKVQFMRKIQMTETTETAEVFSFLDESKNFFDIMAQEDPAYQRVEML